jgi:Ca-activated chloride channel family protein
MSGEVDCMMRLSRLIVVLAVTLPAGLVPAATRQGRARHENPLFKVDVETVFVKVSVTDPLDRCVTGLDRDSFKVFEDKVEQEISVFRESPAPVSVGIIFDVSGSMKTNGNIVAARAALSRFLEGANPADEFFMIEFNQDVVLVSDFTHDGASIMNKAALRLPGGRTAIYDAVYRGLEKIQAAHNERRALILITDGEDNSSRYSPSEVQEFAKESDAEIYAIGEQGELGYGRSEIEGIVHMSGGRAFFPGNFNDLEYYVDLIYSELRNQYVLGYVPTNKDHDGKWRKIEVKLDPPPGLPKLAVHAREGYYASK